MSTTTKYISLDFYTTNIVNIYAKQADANSRFVNVTCTDHGKKAEMKKSNMSAFIRVKKNDNTIVYNDAVINDDGTITFELTQQMLAVTGRHTADITILYNPNVTLQEFSSLKSIDDLKDIAVVSVMSFNLIVAESAVDNSEITSSNEFDALITATAKMQNLESQVRAKEKNRDLVIAEAQTATKEANEAASKANAATANANSAADKADAATTKANTAAKNADDKANKADIAANRAETAASDAETAVAEFESIKNHSGIIMQSEKGQANGIASLDGNGKVTSGQLNIANNLTTTTTGMLLDASQGNTIRLRLESIESTLNGLSTIHFSSTVDNSIGENGDILMVPIS